MNELITPAWGLLITPGQPFTQDGPPEPALRKYGNLSVTVSPEVGV